MSRQSQRKRRQVQTISILIGFIVIFTFVLSLVAPDLGLSGSTDTDIEPLAQNTPVPTNVVLPTPDPNPQFEGLPPYVHSSGYFQTFRPAGTGWQPPNENQSGPNTNAPGVVFQNFDRQIVIHTYVQPGVEYDSLESLSQNYLTETYFKGAWMGQIDETGSPQGYERFAEVGRRITDSAVITDFRLLANGAVYLGRDISRLYNGWLYSARIVIPSNDPPLLDLLESLVLPSFFGYPDLQTLPQDWPTYVDYEWGFALKHAPTWQQVSGSEGQPVRFAVPFDGTEAGVFVRALDQTAVESEEAAARLVTETRQAEAILGTAPVQHAMGSGYAVAYTFRDSSGNRQSGLAVLLNGSSVILADLQMNLPDLNLLDESAVAALDDETQRAAVDDARQAVLDGFIILPAPTQEIQPFVPPTPAATEEVIPTVEATEVTPAPETTEPVSITAEAPASEATSTPSSNPAR